jgi:glycosyltransferase involved in cell wall biosynthesis
MAAGLRILQIYPKEDYFTGAAIQLRDLVSGLKSRGHEVVVATRPSEMWATKTGEIGVTHYSVPMRSEADLPSAMRLARIVKAHRVQVVHAHKGKARTLAMLAGLFVRIPVLILNRGVSFPLDPFNRLGYTTRRVTGIVAVCESIKQGLVRQGVDAGKISVIYSGTDTERFHPGVDGAAIRRELGVGADDFLVTQVGIRSWKGNDDVLDAIALVAPKLARARLLFVGANDAKARILRDKAAARGIADRVLVFLFREDVPQILAASDVTVDGSYAGLGLTGTLRESLAVGTPVIGTAIEGNPELVVPGETGWLVEPRDPAGLAAALLEVAADPARARAMAAVGGRRVDERFSLRAKLDATEALYRRLLEARAAAA